MKIWTFPAIGFFDGDLHLTFKRLSLAFLKISRLFLTLLSFLVSESMLSSLRSVLLVVVSNRIGSHTNNISPYHHASFLLKARMSRRAKKPTKHGENAQ
jgi:hypothetical protein